MDLKALREKNKLSQSALAKALGVSTATISAVETGRMKLSDKLVEAVRTVYGEVVEPMEKKARKAAKKAAQPKAKPEKKAGKPAAAKKAAAKKPAVVIQSPLGGEITPEAILDKVGDVDAVYVRVDENKAYWVKGDESGAVELW